MKDWWDKAEIVGKIGGAIIIPLVVGVIAWRWNTENTQRQTSAQMISIAIGVLQRDGDKDFSSPALRKWAVSVMQNPANPPRLDDASASEINAYGLPKIIGDYMMMPWEGEGGDKIEFKKLE